MANSEGSKLEISDIDNMIKTLQDSLNMTLKKTLNPFVESMNNTQKNYEAFSKAVRELPEFQRLVAENAELKLEVAKLKEKNVCHKGSGQQEPEDQAVMLEVREKHVDPECVSDKISQIYTDMNIQVEKKPNNHTIRLSTSNWFGVGNEDEDEDEEDDSDKASDEDTDEDTDDDSAVSLEKAKCKSCGKETWVGDRPTSHSPATELCSCWETHQQVQSSTQLTSCGTCGMNTLTGDCEDKESPMCLHCWAGSPGRGNAPKTTSSTTAHDPKLEEDSEDDDDDDDDEDDEDNAADDDAADDDDAARVEKYRIEPVVAHVEEDAEEEEEDSEEEEEDAEEVGSVTDDEDGAAAEVPDRPSSERSYTAAGSGDDESEDSMEEVYVVEIEGADETHYYTNDDEEGDIYKILADDEVGGKVGYFKDSEPFFTE
jgi:regulator of replication initiation timing